MGQLYTLLTISIQFPENDTHDEIREDIIDYLKPINDINQKKIVVQQAMQYASNNLIPEIIHKATK